jgi:predicted nucleic acid-binding protein
MYFDAAYIAKYYVNEPDAEAVREIVEAAPSLRSSAWARLELASVFHRHVREGSLTPNEAQERIDLFRTHVEDGYWELIPVTERLIQKAVTLIRALPRHLPLRAGDAMHVATALDSGEPDLWTNDRHLLAAANHFGLIGRSVSK